jgi:hypothetical protein
MENVRHAASFRDPCGYVFQSDGDLYRRITARGYADYRMLMDSGLYRALVARGELIAHKEVTLEEEASREGEPEQGVIIQPELVPHISYPYEWSFSQLQDAARLTLDICTRAIEHGMILKDASAYNIQFLGGRPVLIDTGSFQRYEEGRPWPAYQQFCKHFLAPLLLAVKVDIRLLKMLESHIDGIPLDLASRMLKSRTGLSAGIWMHIHLHARAQKKYATPESAPRSGQRRVSRTGILGLLDSLRGTICKLKWRAAPSEWGDYYDNTNYSDSATNNKRDIVATWCRELGPGNIWDLGGNTGYYSRAAMECGADVVCWDIDAVAVESNYQRTRDENTTGLLPLQLDLTNPSKGIGWANQERSSIEDRGPVDLALALALIHHLVIANNVPFREVAKYFSRLARFLIIEFVPRDDSQVQRLLRSREDIFDGYDVEHFIEAFGEYYVERKRIPVPDSGRSMFLLESRAVTKLNTNTN